MPVWDPIYNSLCSHYIILTYNNYKQAMLLILGGLKDGSVKPKLVAQL